MIDYKPGDFRLLWQDEIWVAKDGRMLTIADMDSSHRINLLGFLRRRAFHLQRAAEQYHYLYGLGSEEDPSDGVWMAAVEEEAQLLRPAEQWIEDQPLVKKLREYVDAATPVEKARNRFLNKTFPIRRRVKLGRWGTSG